MKYFYFISFNFKSKDHNGSWGSGNTELVKRKPITDMEDIKSIQELIEHQEDCDIVVINFQLLRTENTEI